MMKKILILIAVLATMQSCNKFGDTNVSPTLLTKASTSALLTNSQQAMKSVMFNNRLANLYVQHLSEGPYPGSSLYSDRNASFASWYVGPLYDLQTIINYNNEVKNGMANIEPLLYTHKEYRETRLKEATCHYAKAIRAQGASAMGYFAETFTSHDGIYATGIVEKLASCIDIAVIDYNFYDGYQLVPDASVLPTLANYMGSLGYKQVLVGAYAEIWERKGKTLDLVPVIKQTISESLAQSHVIGFEIGGLQQQAAKNESAAIDMKNLAAIFSKASHQNQAERE